MREKGRSKPSVGCLCDEKRRQASSHRTVKLQMKRKQDDIDVSTSVAGGEREAEMEERFLRSFISREAEGSHEATNRWGSTPVDANHEFAGWVWRLLCRLN